MASLSLQMSKQKQSQTEPHQGSSSDSGNAIAGTSSDNTGFRWPEEEAQVEVPPAQQQQFQPVLQDDHIEQMIQELLDYGSMEISFVHSA